MTEDAPRDPEKVSPTPTPPEGVRGGTISRTRRRWIWLSILLALGIGAYFLMPEIRSVESGNAPPSTADKSGKRGNSGKAGKAGEEPQAIPVVTAKSRKGDIGVYFTGLGAVTPLNTVTVKSRVDGQLMTVRYREGDLVREGELLIEIDPRPFEVQLTQAEGQLAKDQAALANARIDLSRYQTLLTQQAIPEQQVATQKALVDQDEGLVKIDQGQIDSARLNISYCHIVAPVSGRIGLRLVDPGNIVHASDSNGLLVIAQIQPISAIFTISEDQVPAVRKSMGGGKRLTVDAYNREMSTKIAVGTLTTLDNEIDPTTGTLKLRATFDNKDSALFPNQFINARLLVEEKRGVTLVPTAAVQRNSQATYLYVVKPDSTVTIRQITIGTTEGDDSEVTSGLAPDEVVVMTGVDKLQEGSKVNAQDSSSAKPASGG